MRVLAALCVIGALAMGATGLVLGAYGADKSANNAAILRTLLLDGKTASAIAAKKTAAEVKLLIGQQTFDHAQEQKSQRYSRIVVREVEHHLDRTISRSVTSAARKVTREFRSVKPSGG